MLRFVNRSVNGAKNRNMKIHTQFPKKTLFRLFLLLGMAILNNANAQPSVFIRTGDFNGDGRSDELWSGGTTGTPYLYIKHGGTGAWTGYFVGPTYSVANTGIDLDGTAGLEVAYWHPSSESMVVITDRTGGTKGYYLGSTGQNAWVQCFNSWTNLDGVAGAEIKVNYYNRCSACKKGYMIIHRTKTTRGTLTCASSTKQMPGENPEDDPEVAEPANANDGQGTNYPAGFFEKEKERPVEENAKLTVVPNPAQNNITIETVSADEVISRIIISDGAGKPVMTSAQNTRVLDVSKLRPGLYLIRVDTEKKMYTGRFMKQ